ncbi:MAG: REP-associated tyrosine transposase, partial [Pyrinomonadaceae bacterium]
PMKHGLVRRLVDWPYSSFHRHVRLGVLSVDWAGGVEALPNGTNED